MGLRERVTITLVIITLIQIACRHCMPRTPSKASLKRYLNDVKPVKNNPVPTSYSTSRINKTPKHTFGKTAQNGRISQTSLPKKSLYQTYKFPENEYPLDNSPRDPFRTGMTFNDNNHAYILQKARNLQSSRINDLKKEMKMKRKLLGNKQVNNENSSLKKDMSSIKFSSNHDSMRLLDSVTFPEIQYPLSTMETLGPNYWNCLPFNEEKQLNGFRQQAFNLKAKEDMNNPFTRLTRAKANKYLQSYDKLKEEHKRTSTENSKRSNAGQKGLNFTKTATCERVSDDFITASLVSSITGKSTDTKRTLEPTTKITPGLEDTCPVTEHSYYPMPIPYKVIDDNSQNVCPAFELQNNTKELQDLNTNDIAQTLKLIEEILLYDDTSSAVLTGNLSKEIENNVNLSDSTDGLSNEDISTTLIDCAKNYTGPLTEELSQKVSDNAPAEILQDIMPLHPEEILSENTTIVTSPLNVRMPLPSTDSITNKTHPNLTSPGQTNMAPLSESNAVPGTTSIIIIPINNNNFDGKSLSHLLEQIMSSSIDNSVPNNRLHNVLSNIAPLQDDKPSSTALESELLNSISDSGSSLPIYETLPTNSMCYNNESSPSAMKEKLISNILIHKSLTDDVPFVIKSWDEKLSYQPTDNGNVINTDTRSPTLDFKHPLFDFADGEFTDEVNQGFYNKVRDNELPILAREISSDQQISNVSSENVFISTQNVTSKYLHKNISNDTFQPSKIANDALTMAMNQSLSTEIPDSTPQPIIEMLPTPLIETTVKQPLPTEALPTSTPLSETFSDKLPEITDWELPSSPVTTTDSAPQLLDITPSPSTNINHSPMITDVSLKTELYKIRQILDKMLSSEIPTHSQTALMDTILSPTSDTDWPPLLVNKSLEPTQMPTDIVLRPGVDKTTLPIPATDSQQAHEMLPNVPLDGISSDILLLPVNKPHFSNLLLDTVDSPSHPTDEIGPPTPVLENPADNKPYLLDNLVTPLSKTRTTDSPNNNLSPTVDDLPSKMDLIIPDIYKDSSDDLPLSVADLPIMVQQTPLTTLSSGDSHIQQFVTQELEPRNLSFDNSVNDLLYPTNVSSISEVLEAVSPEVSPENQSSYTKTEQQNVPQSKDLSPEDKEQIHVYLPLSKQKITEDVIDMEPFLPGDSPPSVSDKIAKVTHSPTDTKDLSLDMDRLLPTEDTANQDTLVTDTPEAVTLPLTNGQKSIDQVETSDELLSKPKLSDITPDNLELPENKMELNTDNTPIDSQLPNKKMQPTSKLPITKALLENVLSDITKGGLSSPLKSESLSVTPSSFMDKTLYDIDEESPIAEAKKLSPVNSKKAEDILLVDKMQSDTSLVDIPTDLPLRMNETYNDKHDILTEGIETPEETETLSLRKPAVDVPLPTDKISLSNDDTLSRTSLPNQKPSSSKLPITKAILENVLSDVTSRDFTLSVSKSLPVKSPSILNKTLYSIESPVSNINENIPSLSVYEILPKTEHFDNLTNNNLPFSGQTNPLPLELVTNPSEVSNLDIPKETSLMDKILPNSNDAISSVKPEIIPKDISSDLPLASGKTFPSSKLPITKALLDNVLSNIKTKGFSLPEAKSLPVESRSQLEKTLYFMESPHSNLNEESTIPDIPNVNFPSSEIKEDDSELSLEKIFLDNPNLDIPTDDLTNDLIYNEDSSETSFGYPIDDIDDLKTQVDKKLSVSDNMSYNLPLPQTIPIFASRIPITKALLEKVLSDIVDGGIRP